MDTLAQIYARHSGGKKFNDKNTTHSYIPVYEEILKPYQHCGKRMIEIGLFDGNSFLMWKEFMGGGVYGIDVSRNPLGMVDLGPVIDHNPDHVFLCDGSNECDVERFFPKSEYLWDVVIDDAAHSLAQQLQIYSIWKDRMTPNSIYIIEDLQSVDTDRSHFESLGFEILDRRKIKNRYDDVLAVRRM